MSIELFLPSSYENEGGFDNPAQACNGNALDAATKSVGAGEHTGWMVFNAGQNCSYVYFKIGVDGLADPKVEIDLGDENWVDLFVPFGLVPGWGTFTVFLGDWLPDVRLRIGGEFWPEGDGGQGGTVSIFEAQFGRQDAKPVAEFSASRAGGFEDVTIKFTDESTNDPTGFEWHFGDGDTSGEQNPSHRYATAGTYTVVLMATNNAGSDIRVQNSLIAVAAPAAGAFAESEPHRVFAPDIIETSQTGDHEQVIENGMFGPQVFYDSATNKTFIAAMKKPGAGTGCEGMVAFINHNTGEISDFYGMGSYWPAATDVHKHPVIITTGGYVIAAEEQLDDNGTTHQGPILVKRAVMGGDTLVFSQAAVVNGALAYPQLGKNGGRIYLAARSWQSRIAACFSDDNGASFSTPVNIISLGEAGATDWAYSCAVKGDDGIMRLVINWKDNAANVYKKSYYIQSPDWDQIWNYDRSRCHTVSAQGAITKEILDAHYTIADQQEGTNCSIGDCFAAPDGQIFATVGRKLLDPPGTTDFTLLRYDGETLSEKEITGFTDIADTNAKSPWQIIPYGNGVIDIICEETIDGIVELTRHRTVNNGTSWEKIEDITSGSDYSHGRAQLTSNAEPNVPLVLAAVYKNGGNDYSDVRIGIALPGALPATTVEEVIYQVISGNEAVSALIEDRVYPNLAPPDIALPYIVFQVIGGEFEHTMEGPAADSNPRVQVSCIAGSVEDAAALAAAVETLLDGRAFSATGFDATFFKRDAMDVPAIEPETAALNRFGRIIEFEVWVEK